MTVESGGFFPCSDKGNEPHVSDTVRLQHRILSHHRSSLSPVISMAKNKNNERADNLNITATHATKRSRAAKLEFTETFLLAKEYSIGFYGGTSKGYFSTESMFRSEATDNVKLQKPTSPDERIR